MPTTLLRSFYFGLKGISSAGERPITGQHPRLNTAPQTKRRRCPVCRAAASFCRPFCTEGQRGGEEKLCAVWEGGDTRAGRFLASVRVHPCLNGLLSRCARVPACRCLDRLLPRLALVPGHLFQRISVSTCPRSSVHLFRCATASAWALLRRVPCWCKPVTSTPLLGCASTLACLYLGASSFRRASVPVCSRPDVSLPRCSSVLACPVPMRPFSVVHQLKGDCRKGCVGYWGWKRSTGPKGRPILAAARGGGSG